MSRNMRCDVISTTNVIKRGKNNEIVKPIITIYCVSSITNRGNTHTHTHTHTHNKW